MLNIGVHPEYYRLPEETLLKSASSWWLWSRARVAKGWVEIDPNGRRHFGVVDFPSFADG